MRVRVYEKCFEERKSIGGEETRDSLMRREGAKEKARENGRETWRAIIHKELIPGGQRQRKRAGNAGISVPR